MQRWFKGCSLATLTDLVRCFNHLRSSSAALADAIVNVDAELPAWMPGFESGGDVSGAAARELVARHVQSLWQEDDVQPWQGGLLAASDLARAALRELNAAKDEFKDCVLEMRAIAAGQRLATLLRSLNKTKQRDDDVGLALREAGMAGLNLRYCYRHFRCLPEGVHTVSWVWIYSTASIKQVTVADAIELVERALPEGGLRGVSLRKLATMPPDTILAIRKPVSKHLRANIWVGDDVPYPVGAHSPLFYPDQGGELPRFRWDYEPSQRPRLRRRDRKIREEPLINALSLYEYI
jgi:hypothetical protein